MTKKHPHTAKVNYEYIEQKAKAYEKQGWTRLKRCYANAIVTLKKGNIRISILPSNAEVKDTVK
jgi:hypothetical protein